MAGMTATDKTGLIYRHRQVGYLIIFSLAGTVLLLAILAVFAVPGREIWIVLAMEAFLLACLAAFSTLTAQVDRRWVSVYFALPWLRRRIPLAEITDCRPVRNHWLCGWGIRLIPRGWMFNVSGLSAVELDLAGGRHFRIGTDQPEELAAAIRSALGAAK
jgi:hypothetical protein